MRVARQVVLSPEQKEALEQSARARSRSVRMVERARIVLLTATAVRASGRSSTTFLNHQATTCSKLRVSPKLRCWEKCVRVT
jgi:hypothetical protein